MQVRVNIKVTEFQVQGALHLIDMKFWMGGLVGLKKKKAGQMLVSILYL